MSEFLGFLKKLFSDPINQVTIILLIVLSVATTLLSLISSTNKNEWLSNLLQNLSSEFVGALVIFILIEVFLLGVKQERDINGKLRHPHNAVALQGVLEARAKGLLTDGSLVRQSFWNLNWESADLSDANLIGVALTNVNLKRANLKGADIRLMALCEVECDENTILPDGTHWKSDEDLEKFVKAPISREELSQLRYYRDL